MSSASTGSPLLWGAFLAFVLAMLALDLGVFHRKAHAVSFREALTWSFVWIGLSLTFSLFLWWRFGSGPAVDYVTGWLIEKSLSVDNIFVFVLLFGSLRIPPAYQHRVLFWGIMGALVLRAGMIFAGVALLERFHWLIYVFGAFLVYTGAKLFFDRSEPEVGADSRLLRLARRFLPVTNNFHGDRFVAREQGKLVATPLLLTLLLVEGSDVVFALDSIPAIFAVTTDPFIVFTSNIFAILGLRSLFFLLAGLLEKFRYLKVGLAAVLVFVGAKMALHDFVKIPSPLSLAVIAGLLSAAVIFSLRATQARS